MYFISLIFFALGMIIILTKKLSNNRGIQVDLSENYLYLFIGLSLIIFSAFSMYIGYKSKEKQEKYSKCPRCKESFNYNELENGKCKYCKDIETIELEEYYKKYPEELKEE